MIRQLTIIIIRLFLFLCAWPLYAGDNEDDIDDNFTIQLIVDPQEKIYLQTDKAHYLSGETVWFSATIVDALFHEPVADDNYLYVELHNPLDTVVSRIIIKPDSLNGYYGHIPLDEELTEGDYILVAYRSTMTKPDYFFKRRIYISDPISALIAPECKFYENDREYLVDISFINPRTKEKLIPDNVSVQVNEGQKNVLNLKAEAIGRFSFRKTDTDFPVLTIRIDYQGKTYRKYAPMSISDSDYEVSFFPEGGQLITEEPSVVAFKAINQNGLSESVTGQIEDSAGNVIQYFESIHNGMGKFLLQPEQGKTYYAVCHNKELKEKRFKLPDAQQGNYSLRVDRQQKWISISVVGLHREANDPQLSLFIHTKGMPLFHNVWNNEKNLLLIEQDSFPSGISHLLLLNPDNDIISERLLFSRNRQDEAVTRFTSNADNYDKRTLVSSKISLSDNRGSPLFGKFAVSVTDNKYVTTDSAITILSSLLLSSELKGHIEDPAGYFRGNDQESTVASDLLMMTQGWRRYNIPALIKGDIEIPEDDGFNDKIITGKAERLFKAIKDASISLVVFPPTGGTELKVTATDNNGRFIFDNLNYPDSTYILVQSADKNDKDNIFLIVDQPPVWSYKTVTPSLFTSDNNVGFHEYAVVAENKYVSEHGMRLIELPDVTVYAPKSHHYSPFFSSEVYTSKDIEKINLGTLANFLTRMKDVYLVDISENTVYVRDQGIVAAARFIVNDYLIGNTLDGVGGAFDINSIGLDMIDEIFITKKYYANFEETPAVVITTKKGSWGGKNAPPENIRRIDWRGYQRPVEFYSPKYETTTEKNMFREDLRTTLYWNPQIQTNENGDATIDFYTADAETTYSVIIEGITYDGKIIRHVSSINRK